MWVPHRLMSRRYLRLISEYGECPVGNLYEYLVYMSRYMERVVVMSCLYASHPVICPNLDYVSLKVTI